MKKLYNKDKKLRNLIKINNKKYFLLKSIIKNTFLFILMRYKAYLKLKYLFVFNSNISIINQCTITYNKKRFNKFSSFSRYIFFKKIQNGEIYRILNINW